MARRKGTQEVAMVTIKEVLRLMDTGLSGNKIAQSCNVSRSCVQKYINRAKEREVSYSGINGASEGEIKDLLGLKDERRQKRKDLPDYEHIHSELRRKGVTLYLLWEEYRQQYSEGYSYGSFGRLYRHWSKGQKVSMRQVYKAGEKALVDYAGMTLEYFDVANGEVKEVQIFVGTLGASNYTFAEATMGQDKESWIGSHERMFNFFGGVSEVVVPDNLKSGVTKACFYDPDINRTYQELAEHYGVAVLPTRVRKPQDKAKAEEAVQNVERRILAPLRDRKFYSLGEINQAIKKLLADLNNREMQVYGRSRQQVFENFDKPALKPLPTTSFEFGEWKKAKVNIDYHIEIKRSYYSVPYTLVGEHVEVRYGERTVTVYRDGKRIIQHIRSYSRGSYATIKEHMPPNHQFVKSWSPSKFINWASKIGPQTSCLIKYILEAKDHPEQGYRFCLGLLSLEKKYGKIRLEAACKKARQLGVLRLKNIKSMLQTGADAVESTKTTSQAPIEHQNIRGSQYYH